MYKIGVSYHKQLFVKTSTYIKTTKLMKSVELSFVIDNFSTLFIAKKSCQMLMTMVRCGKSMRE